MTFREGLVLRVRRHRDALIHLGAAFGIFVSVVALLLSTCRGLGYARDEGFYFRAARQYAPWFSMLADDPRAAIRRERVDEAFAQVPASNSEHPALMKSLFALSYLELEQKHRVFEEEGTSFRFPAIVVAGLMTALTYLWAARKFGWAGGVVGALSLIFMPRVFFQAHLACFDVPIAAFFLFMFFAYDRALRSDGWRWAIATGVIFGLALDTKHNSWFLPIAVIAHGVALAVIAWRSRRDVLDSVRQSLRAFVAMLTIGPVVFYLGWPFLWFDTWTRFKGYASFHLNHEYYNMEFFGENYWTPPMPRTYAPVMTLATVPLVTLAAAALGVVLGARGVVRDWIARDERTADRHQTFLLWVIGVLVSYGAWTRSSTPIFGGTKHWMTAYPFLALLAASGAHHAWCAMRDELSERGLPRAARAAVPLCAVLLIASPIEQALAAHPWGLSAYTPIVGGAQGAASLGLNRTFWGYTTGSLVEYLNREVPKNGKVYPHDTLLISWDMLQRDGRLRKDIQAVGSAEEADIALYHHEMHMQGQEYQAWIAFGTVRPDIVRGLDGVPVIWAYKRPRKQ